MLISPLSDHEVSRSNRMLPARRWVKKKKQKQKKQLNTAEAATNLPRSELPLVVVNCTIYLLLFLNGAMYHLYFGTSQNTLPLNSMKQSFIIHVVDPFLGLFHTLRQKKKQKNIELTSPRDFPYSTCNDTAIIYTRWGANARWQPHPPLWYSSRPPPAQAPKPETIQK